MKRLLLSLFAGMSLHGAASDALDLRRDKTNGLVELTEVNIQHNERLFHNGNNFVVQHSKGTQEIPSYAINREIRSHDVAMLLKLQENGYFDVQRSVNGNEYRIEFQPRLKAGGVVGAWLGFWAGHLLVTVPSYTVIGIISACTGPAAPATFATISLYATPAILATANAVGISGGLAGGIATGPV